MAVNQKTTELTENTARHFNDLLAMVDDPVGTPLSQKMKFVNLTGLIVNAQTGTTYTYLTGDYGKLVTHTNAASIAGTLPQAGATFPANWFMLVQNRGAGVLTITPTTSTIDGAASIALNQNEGAIIVSDGTNYFTLRGKATGAAGVGDVVGPGSATDNALVRFDSTTGKLVQDSTLTLDDIGALTVPEMAAPATPAAGKVAVYAKSDGKLYIKDDAGLESDLTTTAPSGSAGGDLAGTYPNPTVAGTAAALSPATVTLTDGATITWATAGARQNNARVTLGGNRTLDITGEVDGATGLLIVIQDGTGGRTLTLPGGSKVINGGAGAVTLSTGAGDIDILTWYYDGTNFFWTIGTDYS